MALPASGAAQSPAVETIEVRGERLPDPPGARVVDAFVLDRAALSALPGATLDEILRGQAGFQLFRRAPSLAANPTTQGASLRALGGNAAGRALVTLDGVPEDDPFGGWVAWGAIDPEALRAVTIQRGGGAGPFGAGALAGVIALETAAPQAPGGAAALAFGTMGTIDAKARAAAALAGGMLALRAQWFETDGYRPVEKARRGPVDERLETRLRSIEAVWRQPLAEGFGATLRLRGFDEDRLNALALAPNATQGFDASLRLLRDGAGERWSFEALLYGKTRDFESAFAAVNAERSLATPSLEQFAVPAHGLGGKVEVRPPLGPAIALQLGFDWRRARGETRERFRFIGGRFTREREAGGAQESLGAFLEASAPLGLRTTLLGGLRLDRWRRGEGMRIERDRASGAALLDERFAPTSGAIATGRFGLQWQAHETVSLRGLAYRGFRIPTLNEWYRPFRVGNDVTEANPRLQPERLNGIEAGLDWRSRAVPGLALDLTAFLNRIEDAVANVTLGRGPGVFPVAGFVPEGGVYRRRENLDRVQVRGLEARLGAALAPNFTADLSYTYTRARIAASAGEGLAGRQLAQSPPHSAALALDWRARESVRLFARARFLAAQFEDDENERRLRRSFQVEAAAQWAFAPGWHVEAKIENLFGAALETAVSGDGLRSFGPPFGARLGIHRRW
jgi:outer membrane receptor protein involved in Fe transport